MKNYIKALMTMIVATTIFGCGASSTDKEATNPTPPATSGTTDNLLTIVAGLPGGNGMPVVGPAINSTLGQPQQLALDSQGNLYIADFLNNLVEKIDTNGNLSIVAGIIGQSGAPTPGPANQSKLLTPMGVAIDSAGNLYIADSANRVIEKVDTDGNLSIFAGKVNDFGTPTAGVPTNSKLLTPVAVAVDNHDNLYIADSYNHLVEKVTTTHGAESLSVFAGIINESGVPTPNTPAKASRLKQPISVAADNVGNVYIADLDNQVIEKVDTNGQLSIFLGEVGTTGTPTNGPVTPQTSRLHDPHGIAFALINGTGHLFVADQGNYAVESINLESNVLHVAAGNFAQGTPPDNANIQNLSLSYPTGIAVTPSGTIYIANDAFPTIESISNGVLHRTAGSYARLGAPTVGLATQSALSIPLGVAVDKSGNVYIADFFNSVIEKVTPSGQLSIFAGRVGIAQNPVPGPVESSALNLPAVIAVDSKGNVYFAQFFGKRVFKISTDGILSVFAGNGDAATPRAGAAIDSPISYINAISIDKYDNLYIADGDINNVIEKVDTNGILSVVAGKVGVILGLPTNGESALEAPLANPSGVAADESGNIYIADNGHNMIEKVTDGKIYVIAGDPSGGYGKPVPGEAIHSSFSSPSGLALDKDGNLYIADFYNSVVEKIDKKGILSIVAGQIGIYGIPVNNVPATQNRLNGPNAVAIDESGNLYIADSNNNTIEKVTITKK